MRTAIIGLAILVAVLGSVNLQAQTQQPATNTAAASVLGGGALPPQPGPPAGATAEFLIAEGNALLAAGYVDAALQDFQRVINLAPDTSSLVSKGWYGLARCYMSQGNQELAKASLEEVLSRNNDPESVNASRDVYKSLKGQ
ncbi:MAG: tetratricopeptide repeat protein, partial [Candidatus Riflebacteria bacterium]|nr:tetratricopeptide repeat protein [Candidatus Riflebacteria bacterium]